MTKEEAVMTVGSKPIFESKLDDRDGLEWLDISIGFSKDSLEWATFSGNCSVLFENKDLMRIEEPIKFLLSFDKEAMRIYEGIVFINLGIKVNMESTENNQTRTIGFSKPIYWELLREEMTPITQT
jgi:hypothetical protein